MYEAQTAETSSTLAPASCSVLPPFGDAVAMELRTCTCQRMCMYGLDVLHALLLYVIDRTAVLTIASRKLATFFFRDIYGDRPVRAFIFNTTKVILDGFETKHVTG